METRVATDCLERRGKVCEAESKSGPIRWGTTPSLVYYLYKMEGNYGNL